MKFVRRQSGENTSVSSTTTALPPAASGTSTTPAQDGAIPASSPPVGDPTATPPPAVPSVPDPTATPIVCSLNCTSSAASGTGSLSGQASQSPPAILPQTPRPSPSSNGTIADDNPSSNTQRSTDGLSGGTVAGVAIGMFLIGLLIAGTVFFFLLRRQKKKKKRYTPAPTHLPPHAHNYGAAGQVEKGPTVATSAYASNIHDMLPQPVADDTITGAALNIRDNIKNHVREFYHISPVPAASINQANMRELAIATGTSSSVLASMLSNISTRAETLRLVVAWSVLSRCTGERVESLLPGELAPLASAVPGKDGKDAAQSAMYSKWKAMTGALLHGRVGQDTQDRLHRFASAAADLDAIVAPFVQRGLESQRSKNLDMILARSANFAFLLFEQPGVFRFGFSSEHGGLAVFPALLQIIGDQGQVLVPSRVLLEKEIAA